MLNPIKRTVYIPKEFVGTDLLESGYSALAEYSMLNAPNVRCYAAERISQWKDVMSNSLQNSQVQVAVEMWRYNPRKLSTRNIVDEPVSYTHLRQRSGSLFQPEWQTQWLPAAFVHRTGSWDGVPADGTDPASPK